MKNFLVLGFLVAMALQANTSEEHLFSTDLYRAIGTKDNLVFSPYSIKTALGLAYLGAGGETAAEIAKGLRLESQTKDQIANSFEEDLKSDGAKLMKIANKVFLNKGYELNDDFNKLSKKSFDSGAENLDFSKSTESEKTINDWVEKETNGKIKDLLSRGTIDGDTSALLINAIYFKGEWVSPFPPTNTRKELFHSASGKSNKIDFLYDDEYFNYGEIPELDAKAVEMKYKNGDFSMVIVLPNKQNGLSEMAEKIYNNFNLLSVSDKLSSRKIDIYIPKFESEYELDLKQPLQKIGIKTMFENGADFHELFKGNAPPVKISKAFHKAVIKVDEAGSEAAAATYFKAYPMSLSLDQKEFKADHPFLWFIKDKKNIYFMGQYTEF